MEYDLKDLILSISARKIIMGDISLNDVPEEITLHRGDKKKLREEVKKELIENGFFHEADVEEDFDKYN